MFFEVGIPIWASLSVAKVGIDIREVPESKVMRQPCGLELHMPVDYPLNLISSSLTPNMYLN